MRELRNFALFACFATAIAISTISQSLAADLGEPKGGSYKDTYYEPGPVFSWTGFFVSVATPVLP